MKVLCIGDSMGLPRDGCTYENTWFYMLKSLYPQHEFIAYFKRGQIISEALHQYELYYQYYCPDVVIMQTGICDCAPRYINDKKLIWRVVIKLTQKAGLEFLFWRMIKMVFTRNKNCVYTSKSVFHTKLASLIEKLMGGVKLLLL